MPESESVELDMVRPKKQTFEEDWKHKLRRLIRRSAIYRGLENLPPGNSMFSVRENVRQFEDVNEVDRVLESLVTEEYTVDQKMAAVAQRVYEFLVSRHPQLLAVVLMGSSIHGGAVLRRLTASGGEPDFDWGIITRGDMTLEERIKMLEEVEGLMPELARELDLHSGFHSCASCNPRLYHAKEFRAPGFRDLSDLLDNAKLYLQPSFPPEVNEQNRKKLREYLSCLRRVNPGNGEQFVGMLSKMMRSDHRLRDKHISHAPHRRDENLAKGVVAESSDAMKGPMSKFFDSTKLPPPDETEFPIETDGRQGIAKTPELPRSTGFRLAANFIQWLRLRS